MKKKLIEKIKRAPKAPGLYLFKNKKGEIIYVGRAINLKNRLENYLHPVDSKIRKMVEEANELKIKKTKNLLEAIILEANLIKKYEPIYNTKEKDNRSFVYLIIPKIKWSFPRIIRQREVDKYLLSDAFVFGPLKSYSLAKNFLLLIRKIFPYSTCKLNQGKPCFHYQIGLCSGKCIGKISEKDYQKLIDNLINFLKGKIKKTKNFILKEFPSCNFPLKENHKSLYFFLFLEISNFLPCFKYPSKFISKKICAFSGISSEILFRKFEAISILLFSKSFSS